MAETEVILPPDQVPGTQGQEARGERSGETQQDWRARVDRAAGGDPLAPQSPFSPSANVQQFREGSESLMGREQTEYEQYQRRRDPLLGELDRADRAPRPAIPHLQNVGPPPDQRQYQKYAMEFMGAMSLIGAFGSRLARAPAGTSLKAFAAAAEGWQTGNQQAYENGVKQWEMANKQIQQQNENQLKEYDLILKDRSLKREDIIDRLKIASIKHYDDQMYNAMLKGNLELGYKLRDMQFKANNDLEASLAPYRKEFGETNAKRIELSNKYEEMEANGWVDPSTGQPYVDPKTMQPYTDTQKAAARLHLQSVPAGSTLGAEGQIQFPGVGSGRMSEFQQWQMQNPGKTMEEFWRSKALSRPPRNAPAMFMQKYMEEHPKADANEVKNAMAIYNATQSRMRALGTREANVSVAVNEAVRTAQLAQEASDKVPRGKWVKLNELTQMVRRGTSSPEQKEFDDANAAFITAYAQTMSRTGQNTVHAQQRAQDLLRTADGPEAYRAGIRQLIRETNTVKEAVRDSFRELSEEGGTGAGSAPAAGGGADPMGLFGAKP